MSDNHRYWLVFPKEPKRLDPPIDPDSEEGDLLVDMFETWIKGTTDWRHNAGVITSLDKEIMEMGPTEFRQAICELANAGLFKFKMELYN